MKSYTYKATKHKDIFRIIDRKGDWQNYMHAPTNTVLRGVTTILDAGYAKGPFFAQYLLSKTKEEAAMVLKSAGERGDAVHQCIDMVLGTFGLTGGKLTRETAIIRDRDTGNERKLTDDEWDYFLAWREFWARHDPKLICAEQTVFSLKHGYAGTFDALLMLRHACGVKICGCDRLIGKIGLWDWKTSGDIYASYSAQVAAYAHADNIGEYVPDGMAIEYTGVCRMGTKHKTTGGYEMESFLHEEVTESFERFMGCKQIANYGYKPFDPAKDIVDVPDEIEISVDQYVPPPVKKARAKKITVSKK